MNITWHQNNILIHRPKESVSCRIYGQSQMMWLQEERSNRSNIITVRKDLMQFREMQDTWAHRTKHLRHEEPFISFSTGADKEEFIFSFLVPLWIPSYALSQCFFLRRFSFWVSILFLKFTCNFTVFVSSSCSTRVFPFYSFFLSLSSCQVFPFESWFFSMFLLMEIVSMF